MEIVDVLGNDGGHLAGAIETRQRPVAPPRPGIAELIGHGEAAPPGFVARFLAGQELIERDRLFFWPKAPRRAVIGDAAFGRNASPGEWDNDPSLVDQVRQLGLGGVEIGCDHRCRPFFRSLAHFELLAHRHSFTRTYPNRWRSDDEVSAHN